MIRNEYDFWPDAQSIESVHGQRQPADFSPEIVRRMMDEFLAEFSRIPGTSSATKAIFAQYGQHIARFNYEDGFLEAEVRYTPSFSGKGWVRDGRIRAIVSVPETLSLGDQALVNAAAQRWCERQSMTPRVQQSYL
jgi:hypothetical protein